MNKKELRKEILTHRDALQNVERMEKSCKIAEAVLRLEEFKESTKVLLYAPIRSEVDTQYIYKKALVSGKEIYYPVVHGDEMEFYHVDEMSEWQTGTFGVREPEANEIKRFVPMEEDRVVMIMPGAVFDREGNRIGYGGGYYDKYLHWLERVVKSENICKIAVAYECQMVDVGKIHREEHDVCPNYIVTESNIYAI